MSLYTQIMNLFTYNYPYIDSTTVLSEIYTPVQVQTVQNLTSFPLCNLHRTHALYANCCRGIMYVQLYCRSHSHVHIYILVSCLCTKGLHILCLTVSLSQPRKNNPASSIWERGCGGMHEDIYYSCVPALILCDFILHNRGEITAQFSCYLKIYPRYSYILIQRDVRTQ